MKKNKILIVAFLYFVGACAGLYLLMRSIGGEHVPTGYIVAGIFGFAALIGWVGGQ